MTTKRVAIAAFLTMVCMALPMFAQQSKTVTEGPIVIKEFKHDTGPLLREVAPLLPEFSTPSEHEIQNNVNPNHNWSNQVQTDTVLQTEENSPRLQTPNFGVEFDGAGFGDNFFCNCMPPDDDGAPGTTQYVEYINGEYQVFDKAGNTVLGPLSGNAFWSGFGGSCQADNSGDPTIRFDAAAQRWVVAQFAINNSAPDYECVAVSKTADATGAYNRYAFPFNNFPDYPKMGVWPDAYYFTFNNFNITGTAFVGANACAADRSKMLAGAAATIVCFQQNGNQFGELPSDLDGATPPAAGTPNFVMELDPTSNTKLDLFKFHVDFTTPANSTFTGPTLITVASFTPLCNVQARGACVKQPTAGSDLLESLADRLMWRLVYRNFGDHTTLLTTHSIVAGSSGGLRWYEIRNPETTPTVFQSGTFAPDSQYRWMPAIAMDSAQDIAVGFSRSGSGTGQFPSLVYAGRVPSDAAGTLESEVVLKAGAGSQSSGFNRWGDYSSVTVDPTDDCTFWFAEEYEKANGGFNWSTAIGSFKFPGCAGGTPDFSLTASPNSVTITQGGNGTSTITVVPVNGFSGNVTLSASGLPSGVTAGFSPNPTTATSTLTLTASATAATGTATVTIQGASGSLTHSTTLSLTVNSSGGGPAVTLVPTSLSFGSVVEGVTSAAKTVTLTNSGTATLNIASIAISGDFALVTSTKPCGSTLAAGASCKIKATFTPTQVGARTGAITITDNAANSPQSVPLSGTGVAEATLTPATATYAATKVGTTTTAKVFTLSNKQSVALTGITITTTGDFAVSTTTCGSSLAAKTTCKVSVTFTPTATGTRTGTLHVADSANNSPQISNLTGTGK
ncbi:MAG TPA: choice-of-anchor D domain-containing protein [Terriglobales bacterium]|nr:choice-of-anchor D domain-containing protein [Terriglobales bacterium]